MFRVIIFSSLLLAASAVLPNDLQTRKLFCDACERIVGDIEEGVESHEPNILKHCENLCDDILGPLGDLAQGCKDWIDKDFAEIMDKLENDWTPERICKDYHLC